MSKLPTRLQISAGGVPFRTHENRIEIVIIRVGERWQLPKGIIAPDETPEHAAVREVREEAGLTVEPLDLLEKIEYWYVSKGVRFHKFVYLYLMRSLSGSTDDHDHEVDEARWVVIEDAVNMLAFESEKKVVKLALERINNGATREA